MMYIRLTQHGVNQLLSFINENILFLKSSSKQLNNIGYHNITNNTHSTKELSYDRDYLY